MSDQPKQANRIPFEQIDDGAVVSPWDLPSIEQKNKVFFGAKREKRSTQNEKSNEVIEDYKSATKPKPLTAAELQAMAEVAKKEGYDQGYTEGREKGFVEGNAAGQGQGYEKAYNETRKKFVNEIERLNAIASTLFTPMQDQENIVENLIVDMAINFSQEIIGRELKESPESVLYIVNKAVAALPVGAKNISVYVNETDADLIENYLPSSQRHWAVKIDKTIASGGCRVETHESLVDYTCENRLKTFLIQIKENSDAENSDLPPIPDHSLPQKMPETDEVIAGTETLAEPNSSSEEQND